MRTILLFIDGLGWGEPEPENNPQYSYGGEFFRLPRTNGNPDQCLPVHRQGWARPIDAVLGVAGVPQSATGQTTLLSGVNAQADLGKHLTGFPNDRLREILLEHSVLKQLADTGCEVRFINAFRPRFFEFPRERQLRFSATTVANLAGYLPFFDLEDVNAGRSIYQEFTNRELIDKGFDVRAMTPAEAGRVLGRQSQQYDFTLYEYFQSDKAGHSAETVRIESELWKLEEFLTALLKELTKQRTNGGAETLVVLTSDHGNLEDTTTRRHTCNPVPLVAWGSGAETFLSGITRLDQVTPAIVDRHADRQINRS